MSVVEEDDDDQGGVVAVAWQEERVESRARAEQEGGAVDVKVLVVVELAEEEGGGCAAVDYALPAAAILVLESGSGSQISYWSSGGCRTVPAGLSVTQQGSERVAWVGIDEEGVAGDAELLETPPGLKSSSICSRSGCRHRVGSVKMTDVLKLEERRINGRVGCGHVAVGGVGVEAEDVGCRESQRWRRQSLSSNAGDESVDECHVEDVLSRMLLLYHGSERRRGRKLGDAGLHRGGAEDAGEEREKTGLGIERVKQERRRWAAEMARLGLVDLRAGPLI